MGSTFGGIQQASNAMAAAQYGLTVVSQNISNADTPGYTRRLSQQASVDSAAGVPSIHTRGAGPGGVRVVGTSRLNDPVLDAQSRVEHARDALANTSAQQLSSVESIFKEPSDTGLSEQLNDFWNSWSAVGNDPGALAPRTVLLQKGATVTSTLNAMSQSLANVGVAATQSLTDAVNSLNSIGGQLASLNGQIAVATATGGDATGLLDQRDVLLGNLSELAGASATINPNGSADVTVGGQPLVTGVSAFAAALGAGNTVTVGGIGVTLGTGSAAADIATLNTTIPTYQAKLDAVATGLMTVVNSAQSAGFDPSGAAGAAMFSGTGAANVTVSLANPMNIASSSTGANLDGGNALAVSGSGTAAGSPDSLYTALVGNIAGATALADQQVATQDTVTQNIDTLRTAASGVSTDEEISNMLTYQHAFQAASRVLTTLDSMLDTLINHTGLVG